MDQNEVPPTTFQADPTNVIKIHGVFLEMKHVNR
jgi:hypothetical protein